MTNPTVRIAHLNIVWRPSAGVIDKVRSISEAATFMEDCALNVVLCVPVHLRARCGNMEGVTIVPVPAPRPRALSVPLMSLRVWRYLAGALAPYDAVVVRWTTPSPQLRGVAARRPVFTEHHSMEVPEQLIKRGVLSRGLELLERYYAPRILCRAKGIIAVTNEIRDYELARAGRPLPSLVLPNGVSVGRFRPAASRPPSPGRISLAFVSSHFAPWQGLDRLVEGLRAWQDRALAVDVHIVGELSAAQERELRSLSFAGHVHAHGPLDKSGVAELLERCNLGIGSLAVHRKALREACALKVREYLAMGLPVAIAYSDPDLPEGLPWVHRIPADDTPVPIAEMVRFVAGVRERPLLSQEIRRFAEENLDWKPKLRRMTRFVLDTMRHGSE